MPPPPEKVAIATGSEGRGRAGLGRYTANFFVNLGAFDKAYREQRRVLAPEIRWELEQLHAGLIKPKANEAVVSPAKVGRLEKQLRELIAVNGLPPYVSNRFNHQLEVGLAIVCLSVPESLCMLVCMLDAPPVLAPILFPSPMTSPVGVLSRLT